MVSRYVVDGIVIGGLGMGLVGTIYLANGLFSKSPPILRRTLSGLAFVAFGSLSWLFGYIIPSIRPYTLLGIPSDSPVWLLVIAPIAFVSGYLISNLAEESSELGVTPARFRTSFILGIILGIIITVVTDVLFFHVTSWLNYLIGLVLSLTVVVVVWLLLRNIAKLSERQLAIFGLILIILGIATQFMPPVLDLLGIKIV